MFRITNNQICVKTLELDRKMTYEDERYRLFLVQSGTVDVITSAVSFSASADDVFILQTDMTHQFVPQGHCSCIYVEFTKEAFFTICLPGLEGCPLVISFFVCDQKCKDMSYLHYVKTPEAVRDMFARMMQESEVSDEYTSRLLACDLLHLMLKLSRSCTVDTVTSVMPKSRILQRMVDYMVIHYREVTLENMAEHFSYHPNTVTAILKKGTGKTFLQLLSQIRMSQAARLLSEKHLSAQETAERCGYTNMSNFYARFKAYYGVTPGEYTRMMER